MKLEFHLRVVGLCGMFLSVASAQDASTPSERSPVPATRGKDTTSSDSAPTDLTRAEALKLVAAARQYTAHPQTPSNGKPSEPEVTSPDFEMVDPPPAPRAETKPAAPAPNYVWVAGHFMPVQGKWRWVRGEWAIPATPISVWIPARYDAKQKQWSPGYWQPDAPSAHPVGPPAKVVPPEAAPAPRY